MIDDCDLEPDAVEGYAMDRAGLNSQVERIGEHVTTCRRRLSAERQTTV